MALTQGKGKLDDVASLLDKLRVDLKDNNLSQQQRTSTLEQLKVHGRSVENSDPIFTRDGIETLARYAFDGDSLLASREALRCLANALLLRPPTRQIFVDLGYADKAAERLKSDDRDDEFLISRILFLLTYGTRLDFAKLIAEHQVAESINTNIAWHSKRYSRNSRQPSAPPIMDVMAMSETLKLMFNLTHFHPDLANLFTESVPHLLKILLRIDLPHPPLQQPVNSLINALVNLDLEAKKDSPSSSGPMFPTSDPKCNADRLISILRSTLTEYPDAELDQLAAPLVALIRKVYSIAPDSVKEFMESLLLPSPSDRDQPLGKSTTLPSRLLRLSTSALAPTLRGSISALLFELSGKDAATFVRNIGYGYAAGFLMSNNIPVPENAREGRSAAGAGDAPVNLVTGQRLDAEAVDEGPDMTMEEKEREAERLFVLFERLKQTGVVNVRNPVEQAIDEGRFEELD